MGVIEAEAEYLAAAREALRRMRMDVLNTETPEFVSGTDEGWFNTMNRLARAQRGEDLVDLPDVTLLFPPLAHPPRSDPDRGYLGRRHVHPAEGTPLVVDLRAP